MEKNEWIALNYTLPREPSRVRVSVWRHLKKIGRREYATIDVGIAFQR